MLLLIAFPAPAHAAQRGVVLDLTWGTTPSDQDRTAAALRDVGARWVRLNANWADAEPARGEYSTSWFQHYDRAVDLARAAGARIVMLSYQSPAWASGTINKETPPRDPGDFARFMGYLAARYAGKVEAYEVWNEENIDRFWSTGASPSDYVSLLKPAYNAIKQADPNAKVVFGGLSGNDYRFVESAYGAGAKGYFDVMSVHPYTCGSPDVIARGTDSRVTSSSFLGYREVRASMLAGGDDKPIWFTEFGWSTSTESCGVSRATQADYLTRAFNLVEQDPYVQVGLWYNFRNNYWDDADTIEARYGLMRKDFSPKPAYNALKYYRRPTTQTLASVARGWSQSHIATGGAPETRLDNALTWPVQPAAPIRSPSTTSRQLCASASLRRTRLARERRSSRRWRSSRRRKLAPRQRNLAGRCESPKGSH